MKSYKLMIFILMSMVSQNIYSHDFIGYDKNRHAIYYKILNSTEVTVCFSGQYYDSANEYSGDIEIPETVTYNDKTYTVISIDKEAFSGCNKLKSIVIPNSITDIGEKAFYCCDDLQTVSIGTGVKHIGKKAFEGVSEYDNRGNLKTSRVIIKDIAAWCNIDFEDNPLWFAKRIYSDENTWLPHLTIPEGVTKISSTAFARADITQLVLPNSLKIIEDYAFSGHGCSTIIIPNNVETIGEQAFCGTAMSSIVIGENVKSIGDRAFITGLIPLEKVTSNIKVPFRISDNVFTYYNDVILIVPDDTVEEYKKTYAWNQFGAIFSESDYLGVESPESTIQIIQGQEGTIDINGILADTCVKVYSSDGKLLCSEMSKNGHVQLSLKHHTEHVIIVKIGEKIVKVVL